MMLESQRSLKIWKIMQSEKSNNPKTEFWAISKIIWMNCIIYSILPYFDNFQI